ncbi:hypothetical protein C8R47DRAFT_515526 [Mycena vitilis]|nr:hypothetical protein C8R47DRAFT_515526 [Mycena vitilis]
MAETAIALRTARGAHSLEIILFNPKALEHSFRLCTPRGMRMSGSHNRRYSESSPDTTTGRRLLPISADGQIVQLLARVVDDAEDSMRMPSRVLKKSCLCRLLPATRLLILHRPLLAIDLLVSLLRRRGLSSPIGLSTAPQARGSRGRTQETEWRRAGDLPSLSGVGCPYQGAWVNSSSSPSFAGAPYRSCAQTEACADICDRRGSAHRPREGAARERTTVPRR